jgi:hypothetical protein
MLREQYRWFCVAVWLQLLISIHEGQFTVGTSRAARQMVIMKVIFLEQNVTLCLQATKNYWHKYVK